MRGEGWNEGWNEGWRPMGRKGKRQWRPMSHEKIRDGNKTACETTYEKSETLSAASWTKRHHKNCLHLLLFEIKRKKKRGEGVNEGVSDGTRGLTMDRWDRVVNDVSSRYLFSLIHFFHFYFSFFSFYFFFAVERNETTQTKGVFT